MAHTAVSFFVEQIIDCNQLKLKDLRKNVSKHVGMVIDIHEVGLSKSLFLLKGDLDCPNFHTAEIDQYWDCRN
jgi:hypothetical protein